MASLLTRSNLFLVRKPNRPCFESGSNAKRINYFGAKNATSFFTQNDHITCPKHLEAIKSSKKSNLSPISTRASNKSDNCSLTTGNDSIIDTVTLFLKRCVMYTMAFTLLIEICICPMHAIADDDFSRAGARPDIPMEVPSLLDFMNASPEPEQVHISLAGPNRMKVSWVTENKDSPSTVEFGTSPGVYDRQADGESLTYSYLLYKSGLIHHVVLGSDEPLKDNTVYYYRCGGEGKEFSFKTPPVQSSDSPITLAIIGDLGQTGWSVSTLEHMAESKHDMILHAGDLSYADRYQPRWDSWGRLIEPLASSRPWMVTEGNHEIERIPGVEPPFVAYNSRWQMPFAESNSTSNLYYSFDSASVHFIMLGSYADPLPGSEQYTWLQNDLKKVDRAKTPWIITVLHAPWYNSNEAHQGDGDEMMNSMESLLYDHKVDMLFSGHVHAYERSERAYRNSINPCGIIHVTIGDGGNKEGLATEFLEPSPVWSVKREASFGHGVLEIVNSTTAKWSWHRNQDDVNMVADEVWVESLSSPSSSCSLLPLDDQ